MGLISIRNMFIQVVLVLLLMGAAVLVAEPDSSITIIAAGDVMLGNWAQQTIQKEGVDYPFRAVDSILRRGDVVFANLEAPFGEGGIAFEKSYTFRVSPELVSVLTAGHINLVSLANNHILDYGGDVLRQTRQVLSREHIQFAGAGNNRQEAMAPALFRVNGLKVAFVACSLTFPEEFWATDTSAGTYFPYRQFFFPQIRKLKQENDLVLVSFHWGEELRTTPKDYQKDLAHRTIDAGADLVLGHHPHVVQGLEVYHNRLIAYSLGNFVFGSYSARATRSMLLEITLGTSGLIACKIHPINVDNREVEFQPRLLTGEERNQFLKELNDLSKELNNQQDVISSGNWVRL